jgi:hypothetical protein
MRPQQGDLAGNFRVNLLGGDFGVHSLFLFYRTLRFDPQLVLTPTIDLALPADQVRISDQPQPAPLEIAHKNCANLAAERLDWRAHLLV